MKIQKLYEEKGQPRSSRYTKYFNRIKRALEKGDEETLQRTKEAIMYAPAKELKNSEASELMDMIKNKKINESIDPNIDLTIPYDDLEVTFYGKQRDVDVFDADQERTIDYDYDPDEGTVIEQIMDYLVEEDDSFEAMSGDELEKYVETNLEDLFNKYYDKLKEYFRDSASEQASETIDIDQYDDDRRDWDAMPGGHDYYESFGGSYKKGDRVYLIDTDETGTVTRDFDWENEDQVAVEIDGMGTMKYVLSTQLRDLRESKELTTFGAKAKKLNEWAPNMGECPACGDTSFDTKRGKCTKCSYRESLNESSDVTRYQVEFYFDGDDHRTYEYAYAETAKAAINIIENKYPNVTITAAIPERVPSHYKEWDLKESTDYKVKFFQVFEAPRSPEESGKMIGQRGTLDDANAFGKEKAGEGNYIIKAVCTDGKTRPIDNDTKASDYQMEEDFGFKSGDRYYGGLPSEPSALEYGAAFSCKDTDFEELVSYTKDFANETKATGYPVESYEEFRKIIRDQYGYVHPSTTDKLWEIYMDTFDGEMNEAFNDNWKQRFSGMNVFTNGDYQIKSVILSSGEDGWELGTWYNGKYRRIDVFKDIDKAKKKAYDLKYPLGESIRDKVNESTQEVQYGVHSFSQDSIIFRGTEEECGKYIDSHKELWDDAEVYRMTPDDPHYLKEDIQDDAYTAQRYLDIELPDMLDHILDLLPNLREVEIRNIISSARKFHGFLEGIAARHSDVVKESLDEALFEDVEVETKSGPEEGPEFGLSSLLNQAIQDEFKTIDMYNSLAVTAKEEGFEDIVAVIDEINTEENKHVGQLQEILKTVSPNAEAIEAGEVEGAEQIVDESINNSNSSPNNINEGDADMTERAKEIYNSFKEIEKELNGDGEAITAVIDKLYDDNREDPDYKIAWTKWADGE